MTPLIDRTTPVDWWFAFKFNAATYQSVASAEPVHAIFGGRPKGYASGFSLQYAVASSQAPSLVFGGAGRDIGTSLDDPLGATFAQVYTGTCNYVVWNDQFYGSPLNNLEAPWGHSKGLLAWDDSGNGFVLQVSTPSWPASGSALSPRINDGNTLGCVSDDNVEVSQHFFALRLSSAGVAQILAGLQRAAVATRPDVPQLVHLTPACPNQLKTLVNGLGKESGDGVGTVYLSDLSPDGGPRIGLIAKPATLHVPPWQMVSSVLGGVPLRVASWWDDPKIPSTHPGQTLKCWDGSLNAPAGSVEIATSGTWMGKQIGLVGGRRGAFNHAKVGVSTDPSRKVCVFGDMNQQGTLDGNTKERVPCASSQNGRGGLFYVVEHPVLHQSLTALLTGGSA